MQISGDGRLQRNASENDAKARMAYIEAYSAAFPDSKFQEQVSNYAMYTLGPGQLNDQPRLLSYGEKTLAANPNSLPALLLLAGSYVDDPSPAACQGHYLLAKSNYRRQSGRARRRQSRAKSPPARRTRSWATPT